MNYCINRDDRPERWADVQKEFTRMGIPVTRVPAIVSKPGWKGCRDTHIRCVMGISDDDTFGVIFEDDVIFLHDIDSFRETMSYAVLQLPYHWDILYLGASPQEPQKRYSENLYRLTKAWCCHAMAWNPRGRAIDAVLEADLKREINKWDVFLSEKIMPNFNVFVTYPMLATQRQYQSDTCSRSDVSTILKNYNKYCP